MNKTRASLYGGGELSRSRGRGFLLSCGVVEIMAGLLDPAPHELPTHATLPEPW